jgi:hypothetical protein
MVEKSGIQLGARWAKKGEPFIGRSSPGAHLDRLGTSP